MKLFVYFVVQFQGHAHERLSWRHTDTYRISRATTCADSNSIAVISTELRENDEICVPKPVELLIKKLNTTQTVRHEMRSTHESENR